MKIKNIDTIRALQIFALTLGIASIPISILTFFFGLLVSYNSTLRMWLWFFVVIHPIVAILFFFYRKLLSIWLFVCCSALLLYVFDVIKIKYDKKVFAEEQFVRCEEIRKVCKPEYEHMYSWWLCPETSSYDATEFLRCGDFYQTEDDRKKLNAELYGTDNISTQSPENSIGNCKASDLLIDFIEIDNISIGEVVGFNINSSSPSKCANASVEVEFTIFDTKDSLLSGINSSNLLDKSGQLSRSYEVKSIDVIHNGQLIDQQDDVAGAKIVIKLSKTGEVIGEESWLMSE